MGICVLQIVSTSLSPPMTRMLTQGLKEILLMHSLLGVCGFIFILVGKPRLYLFCSSTERLCCLEGNHKLSKRPKELKQQTSKLVGSACPLLSSWKVFEDVHNAVMKFITDGLSKVT